MPIRQKGAPRVAAHLPVLLLLAALAPSDLAAAETELTLRDSADEVAESLRTELRARLR